jgi:hypothetical protein
LLSEEIVMRLGGWHRVGIVLSVLWVLGAGFYQRNADLRAADKFSKVSYDICLDTESLHMQRDPHYVSGGCVEQAVGAYQISLRGSWGNVAFVALAPVPVAWAIVYFAFAAARWAGAGFKR